VCSRCGGGGRSWCGRAERDGGAGAARHGAARHGGVGGCPGDTGFLWFSMVFLWFSMVFLWFFYVFLWFFYGVSMFFYGFQCFSMVFLWLFYVFLWFCYVFISFSVFFCSSSSSNSNSTTGKVQCFAGVGGRTCRRGRSGCQRKQLVYGFPYFYPVSPGFFQFSF
jgi:hypothetical protein